MNPNRKRKGVRAKVSIPAEAYGIKWWNGAIHKITFLDEKEAREWATDRYCEVVPVEIREAKS